MSFIDTSFSDRVLAGFSGGPAFNTLHKRLRSGRSRRRALQEYPLHQFSADFASFNKAEKDELIAAIWVAMGSLHTFRFEDPNDHLASNEPLGLGDGTSDPIQLIKTYNFGPSSKTRLITLPRNVTMRADGVAFTDFTVDPLTGLVTPSAVWPSGDVLDWSGEFDVCVRFQDDYNPMIAVHAEIGELSIVLVEERD